MDLLCGTCGHRNPTDRPFCQACNSYLGPGSKLVESADEGPDLPEPDEAAYDDGAAAQAPGPDRTSLAERPPRPSTGVVTAPCPRCRTENRPELRFCRKCGQALDHATASTLAPTTQPAQRGWWERFVARWSLEGSRAARTAYRRSLPVRVRLLRRGGAVLAIAVAVVAALALHFWGLDVTSWPHHLQ